ncbi:hypothetical protein HHI36_013340 [Cryptolaemus montrouzieri]|uniref:Uncharacterized protein n=1 Tax=Cryptolaemus montrouzieri TaxID=559131 RepID=A0ABD2NGW7_9CUCU
MGHEKDDKNYFVDEVQDLFELLKEGSSYLLHIYLFFLSKSIPLDFIEKIFDNHRGKSSHNFSTNGKTYLYRLSRCIFNIDKHLVKMGLQYLYSVVPLPFMKNLYENFCVNNNLDCADVKLKRCKKALVESNRKNQGRNDDLEELSDPPVSKKIQPSLEDENQNKDQLDSNKNVKPLFELPPPPKFELPKLPKIEFPPIKPLPKIELPPIQPLPKFEFPPLKPLPNPFEKN